MVSFRYFVLVGIGFVPIWLMAAFFSVVMYRNRIPGTPFLTNLMVNPQALTQRGLWARKWGFVTMYVGLAWLIGGAIVGVVFNL
jgi:hypothetical protein